MKYAWLICFGCFLLCSIQGQTLKGKITDRKGNALPGAGVGFLGHPQGTFTDESGNFTLFLEAPGIGKDTLVFSCLGFETRKLALKPDWLENEQVIILRESSMSLEEVTVLSRRPVSEEFSVQRLSQLDIYQNPAANADPLKAITLLPSSTNTDESANPSLRGSSADRSRVIVNGIPVNNPVRFSQLNNIGDFSLFNTAMLSREYIYASNPPLAYGNSTAGVVEIETFAGRMKSSGTQASLSLGSVGFLRNQRLNSDSNYVQVYGNYGFGGAMIGLNKKMIDDRLNSYGTLDGGINLHLKTGTHSSVNLYSYITREKSNYRLQMYGWEENAVKEKIRNFQILSFRYQKERSNVSISHGNDFSSERLRFGNLSYRPRTGRFYTTADYKRIGNRTVLQVGTSHEYARYNLNDSQLPIYYYSMYPYASSVTIDSACTQHRLETYLYGKWHVTKRLLLSGGIRTKVPFYGSSFFLSLQIAGRYDWDERHSTLLAAGKYNGYAEPNYYNFRFLPQTAIHYSLDHEFKSGKTKIQGAVYYKEETGDYTTDYIDRSNRRKIFGTEVLISQGIAEHFQVYGSYTYLNSRQKTNGPDYPSSNSLPFFGKLSVSYRNLRVGTFALSYIGRTGLYYTPVTGSRYNPNAQAYKPLYGKSVHSERMAPYHRVDFTANKLFFFGEQTLITYCAVNNILNIRNRREPSYNADYSRHTYEYYDRRVIYFGIMLHF